MLCISESGSDLSFRNCLFHIKTLPIMNCFKSGALFKESRICAMPHPHLNLQTAGAQGIDKAEQFTGGPGIAGCKGCHLRAGAQPLHRDSICPTSPGPAPRAHCSGDWSTRAAHPVKGTARNNFFQPGSTVGCIWKNPAPSDRASRQGLQAGLSLQGQSVRAEMSQLGYISS